GLREETTRQFVAATVALDASGTVATLTPAAALAANTPYRLFVAGGSTGVTDSAGNGLPFTLQSVFTTGGERVDGTAPAVIAVSPPGGATNGAVNSQGAGRL